MQKTRNLVQLIGYVGEDPVYRGTGETRRVTFSLATDCRTPGENGAWQGPTTWHDIVVRGDTLKQLSPEITSGSHLLVEGEIVYREYIDKKGTRHRVAEIKATTILDLDR